MWAGAVLMVEPFHERFFDPSRVLRKGFPGLRD